MVFVVLKRERRRLHAGSSRRRWGTVAAVLVLPLSAVLLSGCGATAGASASAPPSRFEGMSVNGLTAPNFALRDQDGRLISLSSERGRYVVITFLYVHCKDVCPIIAGQLNSALRQLGSSRSQVRVLAVSVDPRGDTPKAVRQFIAAHRLLPQFRYLTGTAKTLKPIWDEYHVASTPTGKGLLVSHTAIELLLDRDGKPRVAYDSHITAGQLIHDLHALGLKT